MQIFNNKLINQGWPWYTSTYLVNYHYFQEQLDELQKKNRLNSRVATLLPIKNKPVNKKKCNYQFMQVALSELISLLKG